MLLVYMGSLFGGMVGAAGLINLVKYLSLP